MKTWRERIAEMEAEGRGANEDESCLLADWNTCLVGEQVQRGIIPNNWTSLRLLDLGSKASGSARRDPKKLAALLDSIEDEALRIKREIPA
jgi:hypothetical protein